MEHEEVLTKMRNDETFTKHVIVGLLDSIKTYRKAIAALFVSKSERKEWVSTWNNKPYTDKIAFVSKYLITDKNSIDTFVEGITLLKNTKDEKLVMKFFNEQLKEK